MAPPRPAERPGFTCTQGLRKLRCPMWAEGLHKKRHQFRLHSTSFHHIFTTFAVMFREESTSRSKILLDAMPSWERQLRECLPEPAIVLPAERDQIEHPNSGHDRIFEFQCEDVSMSRSKTHRRSRPIVELLMDSPGLAEAAGPSPLTSSDDLIYYFYYSTCP